MLCFGLNLQTMIFTQEEIKEPPSTCQKLSKLVRRRIVPQPAVKHLGEEDQQELVKCWQC